ncbi:MAG: hypothetical protein HRU19_30755 [Pseudobacteriovorax sp.]|nr:hypothetical protein [Pseudobacteriovorax sp.]
MKNILLLFLFITGFEVAMANVNNSDTMSRVQWEFAVGEGDNQTLLGIGWPQGATPNHAWLIFFDENTETVADGLNAIQSSYPDEQFGWELQSGFVNSLDFNDGTEQHLGSRNYWMSFWYSEDCSNWQLYDVLVLEQILPKGGCVWIYANMQAGWPGPTPELNYNIIAM